jgi:fatty-acyl-CoA synthase
MDGLMMQVPLTLLHFLDRAIKYSADTEIVWRRPDKAIERSTYRAFHARAQKLANALSRLGVRRGDRVATLAWNHGRHLEAYFGIPLCGGVLHTLNPRLSVQDIAYIINHADDSVVLVDDCVWCVWERIRPEVKPRHVVVWGHGQPAP